MPNSSGIELFLAIAPFISVSLLILKQYSNFAKSKLTLIEIGIMADNNKNYLKKITV